MRDKRYTITREWCGYSTARWVVRFCDRWVGQSEARKDAVMMRDQHSVDRLG